MAAILSREKWVNPTADCDKAEALADTVASDAIVSRISCM